MLYLNIFGLIMCFVCCTKGTIIDPPNLVQEVKNHKNETEPKNTNKTEPTKTILSTIKPTTTVVIMNTTTSIPVEIKKTVEPNTTTVEKVPSEKPKKEEKINLVSNSTSVVNKEINNDHKNSSILEPVTNKTVVVDHRNTTHTNVTFIEQIFNETVIENYTVVAAAVEASNEFSVPFTAKESVAIAAAVCVVSAIIGYLSCVGYRRFLEKKYGESHIVGTEDVYDTTDLRYFEI